MINELIDAIGQHDFVTTQLHILAETEPSLPEETMRMIGNLVERCDKITELLDAVLVNAAHAPFE